MLYYFFLKVMLGFCRSRLDDVNYGYALDNMLRERNLPIVIDQIPSNDSTEDTNNQPTFNEDDTDEHFEQYLRTDYEDYTARNQENLTQSQLTQATPEGIVERRFPKRNRVATNRWTPAA